MSRNRRDEQGPSRERTPEQRERERLEREARRAASGQAPGRRAARLDGQLPPSLDPDDAPPHDLHEPTPIDDAAPRPGRRALSSEPADDVASRLGRRSGPGSPPADAPARRGRRLATGEPPADGAPRRGRLASGEPPVQLPRTVDRAADRRAARRRPPEEREQPSVLRIQPEPPAPPAAPAGALGDDFDRPIGIRRVRRAVVPRNPRAIVTPPGDVPAGPARARRSVGARIGVLIALLLLAAVIVVVLMVFQPFGSAQGDRVTVNVKQGASAREIGDQLADAGVVTSGALFSFRATLAGKRADLRSGPHTLHKDMTYGAAIDALSKHPAVDKTATISITIPEGLSRAEISKLVGKKDVSGSYMTASKRFSGRLNPFRYGAPKGTRTTEGFLFPATFELKAAAPAKDLVDRQLKAFKDNFASVNLRRAKRKNLTAYDVLIIASMVEREAQLASERKLVAAVIYNRLKDGIPLAIDATTRYALNNWTRPLKRSELESDSAYNTRKRDGLPPTPIGNPGLASIRAAAAPASVSYRYYVVQPGTCGKHAFSSTFAKFQADSQRYNIARNAAGGKSPTTC
jgi:UPF0755 protein